MRQTRSRIRRNFSPESSEANPLTKKAKSHTEVAQTQRKAASKHAKSDQDSMSDDDMDLKNELSKQKSNALQEAPKPKKKEPLILTLDKIKEMVTLFKYNEDELMEQYHKQQEALKAAEEAKLK